MNHRCPETTMDEARQPPEPGKVYCACGVAPCCPCLAATAKALGRAEKMLPEEPPYEALKALAGDPLLLAASDEQELRRRYAVMRQRLMEQL